DVPPRPDPPLQAALRQPRLRDAGGTRADRKARPPPRSEGGLRAQGEPPADARHHARPGRAGSSAAQRGPEIPVLTARLSPADYPWSDNRDRYSFFYPLSYRYLCQPLQVRADRPRRLVHRPRPRDRRAPDGRPQRTGRRDLRAPPPRQDVAGPPCRSGAVQAKGARGRDQPDVHADQGEARRP